MAGVLLRRDEDMLGQEQEDEDAKMLGKDLKPPWQHPDVSSRWLCTGGPSSSLPFSPSVVH